MERTKIYYLHNGDNKPFYIGKSKQTYHRFFNHKQTYGPNIKMVIISEVKDWKRWEKYYIKKYTDLGYDLTNKNEGGGGPDIMTQETKDKIFTLERSKKIKNSLSKIPNLNMDKKGKPLSNEHKAAIKETRGFLKDREVTWLSRPVLQYDLDGNLVGEFGSQLEAQYIMGKENSDGVGACCRGNQKTAYGFKWKYKLENE
tara:strand:- start:46 stop:645 length:600 start_codon:yes stop_codon:yes gene_type:complete